MTQHQAESPTPAHDDTWKALSSLEQRVMQVLAAFYHPVPREWLDQALHRLQAPKDAAGRPQRRYESPRLPEALLESLADRAMLVHEDDAVGCHPSWRDIAIRWAAQDEALIAIAGAVRLVIHGATMSQAAPEKPARRGTHTQPAPVPRRELIRDVRLAFFEGPAERLRTALSRCKTRMAWTRDEDSPLWQAVSRPFQLEVFTRLPRDLDWYLSPALAAMVPQIMEPMDALLAWLAQRQHPSRDERRNLSFRALLEGRLEDATSPGLRPEDPVQFGFQAVITLIRGDHATALRLFEQGDRPGAPGLKARAERYSTHYLDCWYVVTLMRQGSIKHLDKAELFIQRALPAGSGVAHPLLLLREAIQVARGHEAKVSLALAWAQFEQARSPMLQLFTALGLLWTVPRHRLREHAAALEAFFDRTLAANCRWLAAETAEILSHLVSDGDWNNRAAALRAEVGMVTLAGTVRTGEPWERVLTSLSTIAANGRPRKVEARAGAARLVWLISWNDRGLPTVEPREQKAMPGGGWSSGRVVALKRLYEEGQRLEFLGYGDRYICSLIEKIIGYHGTYYLSAEKALHGLAGHPLVFWAHEPTTPVTVVRGRPELRLAHRDGELCLSLEPPSRREKTRIVREGNTVRIVEYSDEDLHLAELLGEGRLFPMEAHDACLKVLARLSDQITVRSDVAGGGLEELTADRHLFANLLPLGEGLKVELRVYPLGTTGPAQVPGHGARSIIGERDGCKVQAMRDLAAERQALEALVQACPTLLEAGSGEQPAEWVVPSPEDCLNLLEQLRDQEDHVTVQWPHGEKIRLRRGTMRPGLRIAREGDWFSVQGELETDDGQVLELRALLDLLRQERGRFMPLGEGRFLQLEQEMRQRLLDLAALADTHGKGVRFHPMAAVAVLQVFASAEGDAAWKAHIDSLSAPSETPLPSTLQMELRDYQVDGFRWMARLASIGAGACLADDMGIGKTVQALALLLHRAPGGPALVVAPTSVCPHWLEEARHAAPTLEMGMFKGTRGNGDLARLGPFDVVVASYALMQQHQQSLSEVPWHTVVLDEAQAIKNIQTRRSHAAMSLSAGFRLITTGTPIENHLGELYTLFRFLNPGLLGSLAQFRERFAVPIERDGDRAARNRLKRLLSPFILRRTKAQVLDELPPRTDITLQIEMTAEERNLYEATRQSALDALTRVDASSGTAHIHVLAEIMRLRRACCHPRLVLPEAPLQSSRLEAFGELLDELLENRHKALVFSQFVDHLAIVREYLDQRGVAYQYLDGSTPAPERASRVAAFQRGEGDLFLISLRAGGTGINLTAADYVIHLDPWWNPAVEDQASDRAHRIGQERPVFVYRLVARHTLEERIVELHRHKRDLANSLLDGTDGAARLSLEDMMRLLREGQTPPGR